MLVRRQPAGCWPAGATLPSISVVNVAWLIFWRLYVGNFLSICGFNELVSITKGRHNERAALQRINLLGEQHLFCHVCTSSYGMVPYNFTATSDLPVSFGITVSLYIGVVPQA